MHGFVFVSSKRPLSVRMGKTGGRFPEKMLDYWPRCEKRSDRNELFFTSSIRAVAPGKYRFSSSGDYWKPDSETGESPFWFSEIRFDRDSETVSISRDQLWIGNLFYHFSETVLIVSTSQSEIRDWMAFFWISIGVNHQGLYESFAYRTTPPDISLTEWIIPCPFWTELVFRLGNRSFSRISESIKSPIAITSEKSVKNPYHDFSGTFQKIIEEYPDDKPFCVLFTGWLDSTILLDAGKSMGKNVMALTVTQGLEKKDDIAAAEYCKNEKIRHEVLHVDNGIESLPSAISNIEDADSVLCGLSISLHHAAKWANQNGINQLLTGSYIEPLLGSNPSTLLSLRRLSQEYFSTQKHGLNLADIPPLERSRWEQSFLEESANSEILIDEGVLKKSSSMVREIFGNMGTGMGLVLSPSDFFTQEAISDVDFERNVFSLCRRIEWENVKLFDYLTLTDLSFRGNIRNSLLNERIGNANSVWIIPVFAHSALRSIIFSSKVTDRFSPTKYDTTYLDNKFFLKESLKGFIPPSVMSRKKTEASVPDYVEWLLDGANGAVILSRMGSLRSRGIFRGEILDLLLKIYAKFRILDRRSTDRGQLLKFEIYAKAIWKLLAIETWFQSHNH